MKTLIADIKCNASVVMKGFVGMASSGAGAWVSFMPQVEAWLRIIALLAGIGVSCVTMWSIYKHRNDKRR